MKLRYIDLGKTVGSWVLDGDVFSVRNNDGVYIYSPVRQELTFYPNYKKGQKKRKFVIEQYKDKDKKVFDFITKDMKEKKWKNTIKKIKSYIPLVKNI